MTDRTLEDQLRDALARDAERAPAARLTLDQFRIGVEGSAQPTRRRHTGRVLGVAAAAVAGVVAAVLGLTSHGGTPAFASWASIPSSISGTDATALSATCNAIKVTTADRNLRWPVAATPAIIDRRGHSAYVVYTVGDRWVDCLATIPGMTPDKGLPDPWLSLGSTDNAATKSPGVRTPLALLSVKSPEGNNVKGAPVTWVSGRIAPDVARVRINTKGGVVEASIHSGLFAAWWPGNDAASAVIRAYDRAGHLLVTLDELDCTGNGNGVDPRIHLPGQTPTGGC